MKEIIIFFTYLISINGPEIENSKEIFCSAFKTGKFELVNEAVSHQPIKFHFHLYHGFRV